MDQGQWMTDAAYLELLASYEAALEAAKRSLMNRAGVSYANHAVDTRARLSSTSIFCPILTAADSGR